MSFTGILTNPDDLQSNYVPLIGLKSEEKRKIADRYVIEKAEELLNLINADIPDIKEALFPYMKSITSKEFKETSIEYFYTNLFNDFGERDEQGKLKIKAKWCVTFDINCAPIEVHQIKIPPFYSYRRFGTIDIRGTPILYYIYFTLQEVLDAIQDS